MRWGEWKGEKIYDNLAQIYGLFGDLARIIKCDIFDIYVHLINYYHSTINNARMNKSLVRTLKIPRSNEKPHFHHYV